MEIKKVVWKEEQKHDLNLINVMDWKKSAVYGLRFFEVFLSSSNQCFPAVRRKTVSIYK